MKYLFLSTVLLMNLATVSLAEAVIKKTIIAGTKDCRKENVQVIGNGNAFSVLFDQFGPDLAATERGYSKVSVCFVAVLLEVPKDKCITEYSQTLSGGILKSSNSWGRFHSVSRLNGINKIAHEQVFKKGNEILPEDADSIMLFQGTRATRCLKSKYQWYTLDLFFAGHRSNRAEHFLGAIDSLDGEVSVTLRVH